MPIFGHTFFVGAQETTIYLLIRINQSYGAYFPFCIFGTFFAGKWSWPPHLASKPDQKVSPLVGPFESTDISKAYFQNFQG